MDLTRLGRTGLMVTRTGFGALPIQRIGINEATAILRRAYDAGITFFDTARGYTDSEEKLGRALSDVRDNIVIATKSGATTRAGLLADLETSLRDLRTDYVDILQIHNPAALPDPDDTESSYAGLMEAKAKGMVRFVGISQHSQERAYAAVDSGLYDTLQYPLSYLSSDEDLALIDRCRKQDVGVIAMKPLAGGLLTNARPAFAFLRQFENVIPIWGIQRLAELDEILAYDSDPPAIDDAMQATMERDRRELAGDFCRACGYCLPCPAGIPINWAARMSVALRRMPYQQFLTPEFYEQMHRIENCTDCGHCRDNCPYGLDTPALLKRMLAEYEVFYQEHLG